jgi:predicted phage terminase large subunit-like protein
MDSEIMQGIVRGGARISVNMPPRHGKSEYLSKYFPAWFLCKYPNKRVIITSYETTFAQSWSRKIRDIISEHGENLFDIKIDPSNSAAGSFGIDGRSGSLQAVGAGGAITGKGADLIIIDDPIKNDAEANSQTMRDNLWDWYRSTVYTRLEPSGSLILVMTRWHEDDLCSRILADDINYEWNRISLPALAEANDILGRNVGEALWRERFNEDKITEIQNNVGEYWFNSLYQQSPSSPKGRIFKRGDFKYYNVDESGNIYSLNNGEISLHRDDLRVFITLDLAVSQKESADYTAAIVFAADKDSNIIILDAVKERFETLKHLELTKNLYNKWKPNLIGIESVQYQYSLIEAAMKYGLPVKALKPSADKLTRALPMQAKLNAGKVFLPAQSIWANELVEELASFPNGKHDDLVDCFSYINDIIIDSSGAMPASSALSKRNRGLIGL